MIGALTCVLLISACASLRNETQAVRDTSTTTTATVPASPSGGSARPGVAPKRNLTTTVSGRSGATDPAPSAAAARETSQGAVPGPPGGLARAVLRPTPFIDVAVLVLHQDGAEPRPATIEHLLGVLRDVTGKSATATAGRVPGAGRQWSDDDLVSLANRGKPTLDGQRVVLHLLFLHGGYGENASALGVAIRADLVAIFSDAIARSASPLVAEATLEHAVAMHEVGHLLGLVDLVLATNRDDPSIPVTRRIGDRSCTGRRIRRHQPGLRAAADRPRSGRPRRSEGVAAGSMTAGSLRSDGASGAGRRRALIP